MSSFVISADELKKKTNPMYSEMNDVTAANIYAIADPSIKELIPPPLKLANPALLIIYVSNIKEPTFAEPYMEGGIGVLTTLQDGSGKIHTGVYYFSLQLCGTGAQNAIFLGREDAGLPKKLACLIYLKRSCDNVCFHIERKGVRLLDAEINIGEYNDPTFSNDGLENLNTKKGMLVDGAVLTHRYSTDFANGFSNMRIYNYNSPNFYCQYEPAYAKVKLQSSKYDPWGEIKIAKVLGGAWARNNNFVIDVTPIYSCSDSEAFNAMRYLYTGRFDPLVGRRTDRTPFDCLNKSSPFPFNVFTPPQKPEFIAMGLDKLPAIDLKTNKWWWQ